MIDMAFLNLANGLVAPVVCEGENESIDATKSVEEASDTDLSMLALHLNKALWNFRKT